MNGIGYERKEIEEACRRTSIHVIQGSLDDLRAKGGDVLVRICSAMLCFLKCLQDLKIKLTRRFLSPSVYSQSSTKKILAFIRLNCNCITQAHITEKKRL